MYTRTYMHAHVYVWTEEEIKRTTRRERAAGMVI